MSAPLDFFRYDNQELQVDGVSLSEIARKVGTPAYVYSAQAMLKPLKELQDGLKAVNPLVCFAVKSNSSLAILKMLGQAGAGMDLVSGGELFRARQAGVPTHRIVFSGVGKSPQEMRDALEQGIYSFNVESSAELELLNEIGSALGRKAPVALRFNPDVNPKTHPYISTGLKKNKFGLDRSEILAAIRKPSELPFIEFKGLSIHIGSQLTSLSPLRDAFSRVRDLIAQMDRILAQPLEFVDLGGGLGITYKNEKVPKISDYCKLVLKYFGPRSTLKRPIRVLIEPGRSITGNAGVLLTEVIFRKVRKAKDFVIIDAAMNDLIRPALYQSYHEIVPVDQKLARGPKRKVDIVGPVCESSDCFASDRNLPKNVMSGHLLAILSAGAYGFVMSSNYNTRPRPPEVLVENGSFRIIRAREKLEDLIRGEEA